MSAPKPFLEVLAKRKSDRLPFWFMRQAGRYLPEYRELRKQAGSFLDLCYNPEMASEVTLQPIRRFGMNAAILFSDILVVPHGLGMDVSFREGEGPSMTPIASANDLKRLSYAKFEDIVSPVYETVRRVKAALPMDVALIGFAGAPWTVACYMVEGKGSRDFEKVRRFSIEQKAVFAEMIEKITEATIMYLTEQVKAGAEALQLFDSWAGVLPEQDFREWVIKPAIQIVKALKSQFPHVPIIGFPRLAGGLYQDYAQSTGVDGVSLDFIVPLLWAHDNLSPTAVLQGNLDPILLATDIKAALAQAEVIVERMRNKHFIFNLGHGMVPYTPVEHVQALSDYLREIRL